MARIIDGRVLDGTLQLVVKVKRLDASVARDFKEELQAAWTDKVRAVSIDLANVEFVDSSGIGAMLGVFRRLGTQNASVQLLNVRAAVQAVIELLRLNRVFEVKG